MERSYKMPLWVGIVALAVCIDFQFLAALILPPDIGLFGSLILEVALLAIAIIPVLIMKIPLKEVFPFRKPSWNHLLAVPVLYYASTCITSVIVYLTGFLFPEKMLGVMDYISEATSSVPGWATFVIMAFAAPLCEEPFHRGLLQYSTGRMKSSALRIILIGIFFGIFHLEPYRFFITGALGILLAYIMLETDNLLIPMLFHFLNNAVSAVSSLISPDSAITPDASAFSAGMLGIVLCLYGTVGPFILYGGVRLLTLRSSRSSGKPFPNKKFLVIAACIAGFCLITGIALMFIGRNDLLQAFSTIVTDLPTSSA